MGCQGGPDGGTDDCAGGGCGRVLRPFAAHTHGRDSNEAFDDKGEVSYISADTSVATVETQSGLVTIAGPGITEIIATKAAMSQGCSW